MVGKQEVIWLWLDQPLSRNARNTMPAQPVDATPSDMNHFLKVMFMTQGKRVELSAEQRTDMWHRWKAGESLHESGRQCSQASSMLPL
jgi:hypothetical protein